MRRCLTLLISSLCLSSAVASTNPLAPRSSAEANASAQPPHSLPESGIENGETATTLPFELPDDLLCVQVNINKVGPFRFILDTAAAVNCLAPATAKILGLKSQGRTDVSGVGEKVDSGWLTTVDRVQIGNAWLARQSFRVVPGIEKITEVDGVPGAGILGYEVFRHFVARLEYSSQRLTLSQPGTWKYRGSGVAVPFLFSGYVPQVEGKLDGIAGKFKIDTGCNQTVVVYSPFVTRHDLIKKAHVAYKTSASGVGGPATAYFTRAKELMIGELSLKAALVHLSTMTKGLSASESAAGIVGQGFLRRFDLTLDYRHHIIYFEKNSLYGWYPRWTNKTGFSTTSDGSGKIVEVLPHSPAEEAGIRVGDVILEVNGTALAQFAPIALDTLLTSPAGTRVKLKIGAAGHQRTVTLTLRELL
jgi:predicted aspartyl protease